MGRLIHAPSRRGSITSFIVRDKRDFVRAAELCVAVAMRAVPRSYRFRVALLLAWITLPFLRLTAAYREQQVKKFLASHEIAVFLLLNALTKNGTDFNFDIAVNGYEHFAHAYDRSKGVLVIGHHAALTQFMVRFFHDHGFAPIVITPDSRLRVPGTRVKARTVQPSPMFLVQLRSRLRRGELICAMPDRAEHHVGRTVEFMTPAGRVIVAPAMIEVAARCNAAVVFTEVRVERNRLIATISAPAASSNGAAPAITEDFISFVKERTAAPLQA